MTAAPKEQSRLQQFVIKRIHELQDRKSQNDIAREAGFVNSNFISILKAGRSKLALDRVPAMAKALDTDPAHLFRLAMEQFFDKKALDDLLPIFQNVVSENEAEILDVIRDASGKTDPRIDATTKKQLEKLFSKDGTGKHQLTLVS